MKMRMMIKKVALESGARLYLKALPRQPDLAGFMLLPAEKLNDAGEMVKVIKKAQKEEHPFFKVLTRLATEINPKCRDSFIRRHVPLLFETQREDKGFFPKVLIISVTSRCNFTCNDCFNNAFSEKGDLSTEVLDKVLSEAEEKGTKIVAFSGGEPLMRRDLFEIIERHPGLYFQIFTNGSLISDAVAERMARLGNVMPFLSLEGDESLTDKRRGKGCYRRVFDAMRLLKRRGVIFGSNVMITPENFTSATSDEFVTRLIEAGAMIIWYITYRPIGENPDFDLVLSKKRHLELYRRVQMIRNTYPIVALENLHDVSYFGGCPAKLGVAIHIDHMGNVTPCPPLHFTNQNITQQSLEEALNTSALINEIMRRDNKGCIILEEPNELLGLIERTGARETGEGEDSMTLKRYMAWKTEDSEEPDQAELVEDSYMELKEALMHA